MNILDLVTNKHNEYIPRGSLMQTAAESPEIKQSPSISKNGGKRGIHQRQKMQAQTAQDPNRQAPPPESMVNDYGITKDVWQFLEVSAHHTPAAVSLYTERLEQIAETMSAMQPLMNYHQSQIQKTKDAKNNPPVSDSLNQICHQFAQSQFNSPQFNQPANFNPALQQQLQQQQQQQHQHQHQLQLQHQHHQQQQQHQHHQQQHALNSLQLLPGGSSHFVSPAQAAHLNLPTTSASPATLNMSPGMQNNVLQNHLGGNPQQIHQPPTSAGMVAQQSQQGTNTSQGTASQGTSANASPNVPNKRRRVSAIKAEGDDGGGGIPEVNGTAVVAAKVKASPRPGGGNKRQKGNG